MRTLVNEFKINPDVVDMVRICTHICHAGYVCNIYSLCCTCALVYQLHIYYIGTCTFLSLSLLTEYNLYVVCSLYKNLTVVWPYSTDGRCRSW